MKKALRRLVIRLLIVGAIAAAFAAFSGDAAQIRDFSPPFSGKDSGAKILAGQIQASHWADNETGGAAVYAGAWIGGASSYGFQYVDFYVPERANVRVTAQIEYSGFAFTLGFPIAVGAFTGLQAVYFLDKHGSVIADLQSSLVENVFWNLVDIGFITAGAWAKTLESAKAAEQVGVMIVQLKAMKNVVKVARMLGQLKTASTTIQRTLRFSVQLDPGYHRLGVGLQATVSSAGVGHSYAGAVGRIKSIHLQW
jgi:hypothetical protein